MRRGTRKFIKLLGFLILSTVVMHYTLMDNIVQWANEHSDNPFVKNKGSGDHHVAWFCGCDWTTIDHRDYHNYTLMMLEKRRKGHGEQGTSVVVRNKRPKDTQGLNGKVSDMISLDRAIRDIRHPLCSDKRYLSVLPTVSVVIPLCEEHWNTLLRTVHSVLNRSPPNVLKEIILVDDFSTKKYLKKPLDDHVANNYDGRVRLLHTERREGLIRARLLGARHATGQVLVFLDSHVEANYNWLPPLLDPIARDYKTVTCPFIDTVDKENFLYRAQDNGRRGAFDWFFDYKRLPKLAKDIKRPAEPFKSPVMAGGLFAISTKWFWELGGYDPGLEIWGGEQYELSFKIWQCGGLMLDIPCSRVGHIYGASKRSNPQFDLFKNFKRVAEVWMDEYAEYLYLRNPRYREIDPGDLTEQRAMRDKLKCKPFKWFIKEVAFDLIQHYPTHLSPSLAKGQLRSVFDEEYCVAIQTSKAELEKCESKPGLAQNLELTSMNEIKLAFMRQCLDFASGKPKRKVSIFRCHSMRGNQFFKYSLDNQRIYHRTSKMCLDCDEDMNLFMDKCDGDSLSQQWTWTKVNETDVRRNYRNNR